jgi:hypothetical protein
MPIRHTRSLRALAAQRRSRAADAVAAVERALFATEAELLAVAREMARLSSPDGAPASEGGIAALLEADALDRESRRRLLQELASRRVRLESEGRRIRADLDAAREALAHELRVLEALRSNGD